MLDRRVPHDFDAQIGALLAAASDSSADQGLPSYPQLQADLARARDRADSQTEASVGLDLGTLTVSLARAIEASGGSDGLPPAAAVWELATAQLTAALQAAEAVGDDETVKLALLQLADCELGIGAPADAKTTLARLLQHCVLLKDVVLRYQALSRVGDCELTIGAAARALESYEAAFLLARDIADPAEQANQLGKIASAHAALNQLATASEYYRRSRMLWLRIHEDTNLRDQVVIHPNRVEFVADSLIVDLDKRIRELEIEQRRTESLANLSALQECRRRTAMHCLNIVADAAERWRSDGDRPATLRLFDEDWELVRHSQSWAADNATLLEAAADICISFALTGRSMLDRRVGPAERQRWTKAALAVAEWRGDRKTEASLRINLSYDELDLGHIDDAQRHAELAKRIGGELHLAEINGKALHALGHLHHLQGRFDEAYSALERSHVLLRDSEQSHRYLSNQVAIYVAAGNYVKAVELGTRDLDEAVREHDMEREARALTNLGVSYSELGEFRKSITCQDSALVLFRNLGDRQAEAEALLSTAGAYIELGDFERAELLLQESLGLSRQYGYRQGEEGALGNLGNVFRNTGRNDEAMSVFGQALEIAREGRHLEGQAMALYGRAAVQFARGEYDKAVEGYALSLELSSKLKNPKLSTKAAVGLAQVAISKGDARTALTGLEESLELARGSGDRNLTGSVLVSIAVASTMLARYDDARRAAVEAREIAESYNNTDRVEEIDRILRALLRPGVQRPEASSASDLLYQRSLRAMPYLRRDGIERYSDRTEEATGAIDRDFLKQAGTGIAMLNGLMDSAGDEETGTKYLMILMGSLRRATDAVMDDPSVSRLVDAADLGDETDYTTQALAMRVAILAAVRFPDDLTAVARALRESETTGD